MASPAPSDPAAAADALMVAYATPARQSVVHVAFEQGMSVRKAIEASGIVALHPEIDPTTARVGIFGRLVGLDDVPERGDRIEIYRPLQVDPKTARNRRVAKARASGAVEGRRWLPRDSR
ncbi:RnfH family protein [Chitinasiproducens palmae]|uniref:UPF0125 protein SAMN05216551_10312 n=1 Tax=Chitinasiproducens palmae TaxID=1770053 RepID=A0A1H2PMU6_9BURK|nr:RnfH family protein [Chitinasiproducens palmae]SDV47440.1 hypothetical protein SAMN05216551_10312 [Chitinasiproducens palmae]